MSYGTPTEAEFLLEVIDVVVDAEPDEQEAALLKACGMLANSFRAEVARKQQLPVAPPRISNRPRRQR